VSVHSASATADPSFVFSGVSALVRRRERGREDPHASLQIAAVQQLVEGSHHVARLGGRGGARGVVVPAAVPAVVPAAVPVAVVLFQVLSVRVPRVLALLLVVMLNLSPALALTLVPEGGGGDAALKTASVLARAVESVGDTRPRTPPPAVIGTVPGSKNGDDVTRVGARCAFRAVCSVTAAAPTPGRRAQPGAERGALSGSDIGGPERPRRESPERGGRRGQPAAGRRHGACSWSEKEKRKVPFRYSFLQKMMRV